MTHAPASEPRRHAAYGLPTLLIADDDAAIRSMLNALLERSFRIVGAARDADEAIAMAVEHRPDVAIIDVEMPAGGGLRATREIAAQAPATAIAAFSADESDGMVRAILAAGAITYIRKGTPGHDLGIALRRSIDVHAQLQTISVGAA